MGLQWAATTALKRAMNNQPHLNHLHLQSPFRMPYKRVEWVYDGPRPLLLLIHAAAAEHATIDELHA